MILDIFEELLDGRNVTDHRPRIEHAQIMTPADLKRISELGGRKLHPGDIRFISYITFSDTERPTNPCVRHDLCMESNG